MHQKKKPKKKIIKIQVFFCKIEIILQLEQLQDEIFKSIWIKSMKVKFLVFPFFFFGHFFLCINTDVQLLVYHSIIAMSANKLLHRLKNIYL